MAKRAAELPIKCAAHPAYRGEATPRVACHQCWMVWEVRRDLRKGKLIEKEK